MGRLGALVLLSSAILIAVASPGVAGPGVRLSHGVVHVDQVLFKGGAYQLPDMTVSNPGDVVASYEIAVVEVSEAGLSIDSDWLHVEPVRFELAPGEARVVQSELVIPDDARLGRYEGLIAARMLAPDDATGDTGARLGAGAAAQIQFEVGARTLLEEWMTRLSDAWADATPWSYLALIMLWLSAMTIWVARRYRIHIEPR